MDQRRPRLGDIVDDYCPRERRLTNHAVVAMLGDDIKQTRCTTCDAEHVYKRARVPPGRRKKDAAGALYKQAVAGAPERPAARVVPPEGSGPEGLSDDDEPVTPVVGPVAVANDETSALAMPVPPDRGETIAAPPRLAPIVPAARPAPVAAAGVSPPPPVPAGEESRMRRSLIRATLPRPEGQPVTRPAPEFTIRTPPGRNGSFRGDARQARGPAKPGGQRFPKPQGSGRGGNMSNFAPGRPSYRSSSPGQPVGPRRPQDRHGKKRPK